MIRVTRELLNDWLQRLTGYSESSPAMEVGHAIIALLKDSVYVPRSDELRAAGAKVVDVPVIPVQPAPNYRIQIEDGALVGTLDEWRALLKRTITPCPVERGVVLGDPAAKPAPEYRILREYDDFNCLVKRVNAAMQVEGWECQGGVSAIFDPPNSRMCYVQAMVRK